jgi:predicted RNase H-like HicB family nuclease
MMQFKIQFEANLPVVFKESGKYIVACCPILDVLSQGKNQREAKKNLVEALNLFIISCYEHGTLDEVMKECGFKASKSEHIKKYPKSKMRDTINVQIPFLSPDQKNYECHV